MIMGHPAQYLVRTTHDHGIGGGRSVRSADYTSPAQLRKRGLIRALHEAGLGEQALRHWIAASNDMRGAREAVAAILKPDEVPSAVMGHHDGLAAGLLAGLRAGGRGVPQETAVVGYDGTERAEALELTTVEQPFAETGRIAAALLLDMLDGTPCPNQHVNLTPALIARATT
jgi:DNA-binding LacI/PurR family transcriptional regulator